MSKTDENVKEHHAEIAIPINIFCSGLGSLEAITKYFKENLGFTYAEIADILNRDARTIWGTYSKSREKFPEVFVQDYGSIQVPSSLFRNRELGVLEALAFYLKQDLGLKYCQIAGLIQRDDRTVWTAINRARRKLNEA
jgi:hypothetical protein